MIFTTFILVCIVRSDQIELKGEGGSEKKNTINHDYLYTFFFLTNQLQYFRRTSRIVFTQTIRKIPLNHVVDYILDLGLAFKQNFSPDKHI